MNRESEHFLRRPIACRATPSIYVSGCSVLTFVILAAQHFGQATNDVGLADALAPQFMETPEKNSVPAWNESYDEIDSDRDARSHHKLSPDTNESVSAAELSTVSRLNVDLSDVKIDLLSDSPLRCSLWCGSSQDKLMARQPRSTEETIQLSLGTTSLGIGIGRSPHSSASRSTRTSVSSRPTLLSTLPSPVEITSNYSSSSSTASEWWSGVLNLTPIATDPNETRFVEIDNSSTTAEPITSFERSPPQRRSTWEVKTAFSPSSASIELAETSSEVTQVSEELFVQSTHMVKAIKTDSSLADSDFMEKSDSSPETLTVDSNGQTIGIIHPSHQSPNITTGTVGSESVSTVVKAELGMGNWQMAVTFHEIEQTTATLSCASAPTETTTPSPIPKSGFSTETAVDTAVDTTVDTAQTSTFDTTQREKSHRRGSHSSIDLTEVMPDRFDTTDEDIAGGIKNANETHQSRNITGATTANEASVTSGTVAEKTSAYFDEVQRSTSFTVKTLTEKIRHVTEVEMHSSGETPTSSLVGSSSSPPMQQVDWKFLSLSIRASASSGAAFVPATSGALMSFPDLATHGDRSDSSGMASTQQLKIEETSAFTEKLSKEMIQAQTMAPSDVPVSWRKAQPPSIPSSGSSDVRFDSDLASSRTTVSSTDEVIEMTTFFMDAASSSIRVPKENESSNSGLLVKKPARNDVETNKVLSAQFAPTPFSGPSFVRTPLAAHQFGYQISFRITSLIFTVALSNTSTTWHRALSAVVQNEISSSITQVRHLADDLEVIGNCIFRPGSVVVSLEVTFRRAVDTETLKYAVMRALIDLPIAADVASLSINGLFHPIDLTTPMAETYTPSLLQTPIWLLAVLIPCMLVVIICTAVQAIGHFRRVRRPQTVLNIPDRATVSSASSMPAADDRVPLYNRSSGMRPTFRTMAVPGRLWRSMRVMVPSPRRQARRQTPTYELPDTYIADHRRASALNQYIEQQEPRPSILDRYDMQQRWWRWLRYNSAFRYDQGNDQSTFAYQQP